MAGKVLDLDEVLVPDQLGTAIGNQWRVWDMKRDLWRTRVTELRQYIFATDTSQTTNAKLPWSNKTTIPKMAQIRDNLFANYMESMFPNDRWLEWEGDRELDDKRDKRAAIESYMHWVTKQTGFLTEEAKLVLDFIDYGNAFTMVEWVDERIEHADKTQSGFVGPRPVRINPLDIVFNPVAPSFAQSPKIIRSLLSLGEVKEMLTRLSDDPEEQREAQELFDYIRDIRQQVTTFDGNVVSKDNFFNVDGFDDFRSYLGSDVVEVLTFYGDMYDENADEYLRNHVIQVVDRHKVIAKKPNPSFFGTPPIFHVGWRIRQDNLWAMGPLDNLVGMQYRIDHLENLKADLYDLTAFPPLKIKGYVEDFEWGPFERIYVGDDGDVTIMSPDVQALQANFEIQMLEDKMEAMAGAPKEALGIRSPGEKTAFEVQKLENAASRIFNSKILQFQTNMTEPKLNAMLELARRKMTSASIRIFDDEFKIAIFEDLTVEDIIGSGTLKPKAAQHFAEKANKIQNLSAFFQSPLGQDPEVRMHFSSVKLARLAESLLGIQDENIVQPYIRLSEQADAQKEQNIHQENIQTNLETPTGLFPDDFDDDSLGGPDGEGAVPADTNSLG